MLHYLTEIEKTVDQIPITERTVFSEDEMREYKNRYPVGPESDSLQGMWNAVVESGLGWSLVGAFIGGPLGFFTMTTYSMLRNDIEDKR